MNEFIPWNSTQVNCSPDCALSYIKDRQEKGLARDIKQTEKIQRKKLRVRKESIKSRSDWLREAQTACNAYIRERDKGDPCISCGAQNNVQYCAGHYKTRGAHPALRFHPMNIHLQCNQYCNLQNSGNIGKYRPELIKKIGLSNVEWLEGDHKSQNLTIDDIKEIKAYYKDQLKILRMQ